MRLFPYIKKNLIIFIREGKIAFICFLLFPMIMAFIYGIMYKNMFEGKSSFEPIKVQFSYNEASKEGKIFTSILQDENVKNFIKLDAGAPDCRVNISDDFQNINIEKLSGMDNEVEMIRGFTQAFSESINQYRVISNNVDKLNVTAVQHQALINKLLSLMQQSSSIPAVKEQLVQGYRSLGAREYFTISMFSFTALTFVITLAKWFYRDKKQGVIKRSFSTPNKREDYLLGYLGSSFILAFIINFIFIAMNRILGIAFSGSLAAVMIIVLLQSLLQTAVIGAIISFIKDEKIANSIMNIIIFIPVIIGGVFFNADVIQIKILKIFSEISPNSLILNSYKNLSIVQGISGAQNELVLMLLLSLILIAASIIKVRTGWEE